MGIANEADLIHVEKRGQETAVPSHPLNIKPSGNVYVSKKNIELAAGAFAALPDEVLIQVLESLNAISLKHIGSTCKALYAYSRFDDIWKSLSVR